MEHGKRPGADVSLEFGILIFLLLIFRSKAVLEIIDGPSHLEARLGQNVTLPCVLTDSDQPQVHLDLQTASVRWDMRSVNGSVKKVYLLTSGIHEAYRPKYNIEENDFRRGIASLGMQDVLEGDEGEYTCSVYITPYKFTSTISVQVSAKPTITLTSYELTVEPGHERSVLCEVNRFYPKTVTIRWFKSSKHSNDRRSLDKEICNSVPAENNDGTFNTTSLIFVKPSSTDEDGDIYSCIVSHRSFDDDQAVNLTLIIKEHPTTYWRILWSLLIIPLLVAVAMVLWWKKDPMVSSINGAEYLVHMKKSTLWCFLSYFKSDKIKINIYLVRTGAPEKQLICFWKPSQEENECQNNANDEALHLRTPSAGVTNNLETKVEPLKPERSFIFFYSCPCIIQITPDIETDDEAELTLEIIHSALKTPISISCNLRVNGDCLKLQPIRAPEHLTHDQEVTLTCNITKYSPGPLHIVWLKKDLMKQKATEVICKKGETRHQRYSHSQEEHQDGRVFAVSSSLTFMAKVIEDHGKKYICQVFYPALSQNMESALDSYVRAVPVLEPITAKPPIPSADQQMELSCKILSFHPRELMVEWYKEDDLVPQTTDTKGIGDDGLYSATSTLKHICEQQDLGKTFKCKVGHESLKDPQILEWTLDCLRTPLDNTQNAGPP